MNLLLADLRALANLPTTATGRRVTFGFGVGLGLLALMSWMLAEVISNRPHISRLIAERADGDPLLGMLGFGLFACPMVATWLGMATAQRQLFETPETWLWRQAPIAGWRGPMQILLRAVFMSSVWAAALSAPFLVSLLRRSPEPTPSLLLVPVAIVCCTAPLLATLLTVQIVLVRFLAGRTLKLVLTATAGLASAAFTAWLLLTLFTSANARLEQINTAAMQGQSLPWTINSAATMLRDAAFGRLELHSWLPVVGWLAFTVTAFAVAARLFPRALERYIETDAPLWRRTRRDWPTSLTANMRKKEFAQVLQQPGALIGFLVFAVLVFALAYNQVLTGTVMRTPVVPRELRNLAAMLLQWLLAVLLVIYPHMSRLALWDGAQWSLYMSSPASPHAILRGKLGAIAVFLLWPLLLVAAINVQTLGVQAHTVVRFVAIALAGTLAALGVLAVIGTWPRLMRPDIDGQILQGGKSFLAAMVLLTTFELSMSPGVLAWSYLAEHARRLHEADDMLTAATIAEWTPWVIAATIGYGALIGSIGLWLGGRNYRRLLAPQ